MAPHDLLCKWCSTFVGKNKHFCSIFCESRHTRSKRRKLPFKKPANFSGNQRDTEYESPRTNKTYPRRKENFLEEVMTAMDAEQSERDKARQSDDTAAATKPDKTGNNNIRKAVVPKLKLSPKEDNTHRPELLKYKTQILITKPKAKIPVISPTAISASLHSMNKRKKQLESENQHTSPKVKPKVSKSKGMTPQATIIERKGVTPLETSIGKTGEEVKEVTLPPIQKQKSHLAIELEKRVSSSGYGAPINPKLRPSAIKPKSASFLKGPKRQSSASSIKSTASTQNVMLPHDAKETKSLKSDKGASKMPETISEETARKTTKEAPARSKRSRRSDSETPDSTPKSRDSELKTTFTESGRTELEKINELIREETSASVFIDNSLLQSRLSSIKRKVEVKKRGRDSRSSMGSDMDAFMGSMNDITTDQEPGLELSSLQLHQKTRPLESTTTSRDNVTDVTPGLPDLLTA